MLIQITLVGCVAAYAAYEVLQIFDPTEPVPVQTTLQEWHGAGKWALCSQLSAPDSLLRAGVALPTRNQTLSEQLVAHSVGAPMRHMNIETPSGGGGNKRPGAARWSI